MGKGKRIRAQKASEKTEKRELELKLKVKKQKAKRVKILVASLCAVVILAIIGTSVYSNSLLASGHYQKNTALSTANFKVTNAMLQIFLSEQHQNNVKNYGSYLNQLGYNPAKMLKDQYYNTQTGSITWLEFTYSLLETNLTNMLVYAEAAKKASVTLSADELAGIEKTVEVTDVSKFGKNITKEDYKACLELRMLYLKYANMLNDVSKITEDEVMDYFNKNTNSFLTYTYRSYSFDYDDEKDDKLDEKEAKEYANKLKAAKDVDEYLEILKTYMKDVLKTKDSDIDKNLEATLSDQGTYVKNDVVSTWAFDEERKVGDTYIKTDTTNKRYTVYIMVELPKKDESKTVNVRHILFSTDNYGTEEKAKEAADKVYKEWQDGGATEELFDSLARKYTTDPGSATQGGLYLNVVEGTMVANFNKWCFDESRKEGDSAVISTSFGYHIMYYVSDGDPAWKADVKSTISDNNDTNTLTNLQKEYSVTKAKNFLSKIYL